MIKAFVLGSLNIDHFLSVDHIVQESETTQVLESIEFLGGKGANQAVAMAMNTNTVFVANVGVNDEDRLIKELEKYSITPRLSIDKLSGLAIVQVDKKGENAILLIPNANKTWDFLNIYSKLKDITDGDYIVLQNEVSLHVVKQVLEALKDLDLTIVLNPAPFTADILDIIEYVDILVLNRIEAEQLVSSIGQTASSPRE
jgi:ribokinase